MSLDPINTYYDEDGVWNNIPVTEYDYVRQTNDDFYDSYPGHRYPAPNYPDYGRNQPHWLKVLEVVIRIVALISVFAANYAHLAWTLKRPQRSARLRILKLLLVIFMPTFVISECLFSLFSTIFLVFQMDSAQLRWPENAAEWKRYFCSIAGMYVVPDPEVETEAEGEVEDGVPTTATNALKPSAGPVTLSQVQYYSDLRHHPKPWNTTAILRIILVFLASLVPIIFALIPYDTFTDLDEYYDVRYIITIASNGVCTIAALIAVACRSEWSLVHLTTSSPTPSRPFFSFVYRLILAALIYETFYFITGYMWYARFSGTFLFFFLILGWCNIFWPVIAFAAWIWRAEIAERVKINWWLVFATMHAALCLWIGIDMLCFFIGDLHSIINFY